MDTPNPTTVSIIVAVHNQRDQLQRFHTVLCETLWRLPYHFELVFVDDGSTDKSGELVVGMAKRDPRIRLFISPHHFGGEAAIAVGLHAARGASAIIMDPVMSSLSALIPQMLRLWEDGVQMVTVAMEAMRRLGTIVADLVGPRLVDRAVINAYEIRLTESRSIISPLDRMEVDRRATISSLPGNVKVSNRSSRSGLVRRMVRLGPVLIHVIAAALLSIILVVYFASGSSGFLRDLVLLLTSLALYGVVLSLLPLVREWQVRPFVELGALLRFALESFVEHHHPHAPEDVSVGHAPETKRGAPPPSTRSGRFLKFVRHFPPAAYA